MSEQFDVVIVGAGIAGGILAHELAKEGKSVLILEAGPAYPANRSALLETFFNSSSKFPESPYPPTIVDAGKQASVIDPSTVNAGRATIRGLIGAGDPKQSYLIQPPNAAFTSTYERHGGGTTWHWMGTAVRLFPNDFRMQTAYGVGVDWPLSYDDLNDAYGRAEWEIGVAGEKADMQRLGIPFPTNYNYPMHRIPQSVVDQRIQAAIDASPDEVKKFAGKDQFVSATPQGRRGQFRPPVLDPHMVDPYQETQQVCAGNTNCIPMCPIQAKYDATITLQKARQRGAQIKFQTVATNLRLDASGQIAGIDFVTYDREVGGGKTPGTVTAKRYVLAAHAMETPKLLLLSNGGQGVANSSGLVGQNLLDHVMYLAWARGALDQPPLFPFRGPLSTSGIETMRDGDFRRQHSAFRVEIGNEGWNWAAGDPYTAVNDFIEGTNAGGLNDTKDGTGKFRKGLKSALNANLTRTFRFGFLFEQDPGQGGRVVPSKTAVDGLGIPRPEVQAYGLSDYTKRAYPVARKFASALFKAMGATEFTRFDDLNPSQFQLDGVSFNYFGAGHIMGTCRMGTARTNSVVDKTMRAWDHKNLFIIGSSVFPTVGTGNPTLTIAALTFLAADQIKRDLAPAELP
jgi:choline dehydrogenase-like flavoprotein